MWVSMNKTKEKNCVNGSVAVAIDNEKGSRRAFKWAIDNLLTKNATVILIHVKIEEPSLSLPPSNFTQRGGVKAKPEAQDTTFFMPYCVFCLHKDIKYRCVLLEDADVSKALIEYASRTGIERLVLGSSTRANLLERFKVFDIPGTVSKMAPNFCTVYVINKGKIQSMRSASRPAPNISPLQVNQTTIKLYQSNTNEMEEETHGSEGPRHADARTNDQSTILQVLDALQKLQGSVTQLEQTVTTRIEAVGDRLEKVEDKVGILHQQAKD